MTSGPGAGTEGPPPYQETVDFLVLLFSEAVLVLVIVLEILVKSRPRPTITITSARTSTGKSRKSTDPQRGGWGRFRSNR
jgi:hypothetical protein